MKKQLKRLVSLATAAVLSLSLVSGACAASLSDITGHAAQNDIIPWQQAGLFAGYPDGTFHPDSKMTRAEFAAVVNKLVKGQPQGNVHFADVARGAWYYDAVTALAEAGFVGGDNYRPNDTITCGEAAELLSKALDMDAASLTANKNAAQAITRGEVAQMLSSVKGTVSALAAAPVEPIDLDEYLQKNATKTNDTTRALPLDRSETNEHALMGYFTYTLDSGRTVKLYIGDHAALRTYITVIAIPNGVENTYAFLKEQGWLAQADANGELLFVLEPANGVWGTPAQESEYLDACLAEVIGNTAFDTRQTTSGGIVQSGRFALSDGTSCPVFTGHSCNYYVGYGEGCAVLESWTSNNPLYVVAQAFIGGKSTGSDILNANSERTYNGINTGSYYPGCDDEAFSAILDKLYDEGIAPSADFITNADIPVPTLFAGYAKDDMSVEYWKSVNDVLDTAIDGCYYQSLNSDAWQTLYANSNAKKWGDTHGISQVKLVNNTSLSAAEIRSFLANYTRYTNPLAYSNALGVRTNYYPLTKAARDFAESGTTISTLTYDARSGKQQTVEIRALEQGRLSALGVPEQGTIYSAITAFTDYDGDGRLDNRESLIYVPDSAKNYADEGAPLVIVFPGGGQAASTFMDASMWWAVANDEGCIVVIVGEFCSVSATGVIYAYGNDDEDSGNFCRTSVALVNEVIAPDTGVNVNLNRIYASAHSAGCRIIQSLTHNSEAFYFAGVAGTSFPNPSKDFKAYDVGMPSYLFSGQSDMSEGLPNPVSRDLVLDPWIVAEDSAIYNWVKGAMEMNGLELNFTANDHDSFLASCSNYTETGRYYTYTWADKNNIPLVQFTRTIAREHNCYPEEFRLAWDYLKHFSITGDGTRYYSESAFTQNDAVEIQK